METTTLARSALYAALAEAFALPAEGSFPQTAQRLLDALSVAGEVCTAPDFRAAREDLRAFLRDPTLVTNGYVSTMRVVYARLFVGPGRPAAHPYESVYRHPEGWVMGPWAVQVRRDYEAEGLSLPADSRELPDHVSLELDFMAHLTAGEAAAWADGQPAVAAEWRRKEFAFLRDHLARWLPAFCGRVLAATDHPFYAPLARLTGAFVPFDLAQTGVGPVRDRARNGEACHSWTLDVEADRCTLCGACVRVCAPRSLFLHRRDTELILAFDAATCRGCAACARVCPDHILALRRGQDGILSGDDRKYRPLASSPLVACAACGQPFTTQATLERIGELSGDDMPLVMKMLSLCPECKIAGGKTLRVSKTRRVRP